MSGLNFAQFLSLSRSLCLSLSCLYSLVTLPFIFCADGLRHIRIRRQSLLSSRYGTFLSSSRNNLWVLFLIMSVYTYWVYLIAGINCIYSFCDWTINLKSDPCEWPPHMILPVYVQVYQVHFSWNCFAMDRNVHSEHWSKHFGCCALLFRGSFSHFNMVGLHDSSVYHKDDLHDL